MMHRVGDFFRRREIWAACPTNERRKVGQILSLYARMDRLVLRFQRKTGLRCVPGCGHCCEHPDIEATALEVLPLAIDLWRKGLAEECFKKIEREGQSQLCVFYRGDLPREAQGHCSVYSLRPTMCRLFGFSATTDKLGKDQLVTCPQIKERFSKIYARACADMDVPRMADFARQSTFIDLTWGQERVFINVATKEALERIGFLFMMKGRKSQ